MSELTKRVAFGVPAALIALVAVFAGGAALAALLAIASAIAAWEFFRLARSAGHAPLSDLGCALAGLMPLAVHAWRLNYVQPRFAYLAVVMLVLFSATIFVRGVAGRPLGSVATTLMGILYTG